MVIIVKSHSGLGTMELALGIDAALDDLQLGKTHIHTHTPILSSQSRRRKSRYTCPQRALLRTYEILLDHLRL
jgi:hypothetical protein